MAGTSEGVSGPDLSEGAELSALPDGQPFLGHVGEEAVVLVRRSEEVFAVGAHCTHYGGPLAEGLVVSDTIRCPWHHAGFCLRTGEVLRQPALNPVDAWVVERDGDRVRVTGRRPAPGPRTLEGAAPDSVVIVGGGAAGQVAAETLRHEGYQGPVIILSADAAGPVDRPNLSKDYLAGNAPEAWIPLRPPEFYTETGIELRLATRVAAIHPESREVEIEGGGRLGYGALLIATGAAPIRLPTPGAEQPHVHTLRTLADSRAIIAAADKARTAVVVGASFIGLEAAASLRARGLAVHVVAPEEVPMARALGPELGGMVQEVHQENGVVFHLGQTVEAIEAAAVRLSGGDTLPADLVVMGVGVRPAMELAERAGLKTAKGVVVDEYLQTSAPGIYAAGDIARWPDARTGEPIRVEHWVHAERQGRTAARNILGARERFADAPFFWSQHFDVVVNYVGHAEGWDELRIDGDLAARDAKVSYIKAGKVVAVATVGRDHENLAAEVAIEAG
jgi:NADPH-dependent 2,4-dienoyl-CoA reductase/sulfur reductase-like enzyme/nitrite reductase/ring-hydroxylating ferredoxin subunit